MRFGACSHLPESISTTKNRHVNMPATRHCVANQPQRQSPARQYQRMALTRNRNQEVQASPRNLLLIHKHKCIKPILFGKRQQNKCLRRPHQEAFQETAMGLALHSLADIRGIAFLPEHKQSIWRLRTYAAYASSLPEVCTRQRRHFRPRSTANGWHKAR